MRDEMRVSKGISNQSVEMALFTMLEKGLLRHGNVFKLFRNMVAAGPERDQVASPKGLLNRERESFGARVRPRATCR